MFKKPYEIDGTIVFPDSQRDLKKCNGILPISISESGDIIYKIVGIFDVYKNAEEKKPFKTDLFDDVEYEDVGGVFKAMVEAMFQVKPDLTILADVEGIEQTGDEGGETTLNDSSPYSLKEVSE